MLRRNFITLISAALPQGIHGRPARISGEVLTNPLSPTISAHNPIPDHLSEWLRIPQQPVFALDEISESERATASIVLHHIHNGNPLTLTYHGGTQPGTKRTLTPVLLFQKIENPYTLTDQPTPFDPYTIEIPPTYLHAHCHLRHTTRTFRLDRIVI